MAASGDSLGMGDRKALGGLLIASSLIVLRLVFVVTFEKVF